MLNFLLLLALNALVFAGSALIVRHGLRLTNGLAAALATLLIGWTTIVVGLELLGLVGQLRLVPAIMLAAGSMFTGVGTYISRRRVAELFSSAVVKEPRVASDLGGSNEPSTVVLVLTGAVVGMTMWASFDTLIGSLCGPVLPVSDAPIYHLYFAARWWQSGRLDIVPTPFGESAAPYFPANGNIWFTWLLLPPSHEWLAKVGQWPFLWIGMAAIFGLARTMAAKTHWSALAASLWGTSTLPVLNSGFADVDLILAAWYLVSLWFLVRYKRMRQPADLICSALAMGAALGTKTIAVLFVPPLLLTSLVVCWGGTQRGVHVAILVAGTTIPAVFWYIRNMVITGNPLYPLHQEIFGLPLLHGWYTREALFASEYHFAVTDLWALLLVILRGVDPVLLPFWLGGIVAAVAAVRSRQRLPAYCVALGLVHVMLFWLVNPYQTQDRFLFAAFGLLAAPVALQFERLPWLGAPFVALFAWHLVAGTPMLVDWIQAATSYNFREYLWPPLLPPPLQVIAASWSATISNRIILGRLILGAAALMAGVLLALSSRVNHNRRWCTTIALALIAAGISIRAYCAWIPSNLARFRFIPLAPQIGYTPGWLVVESLSDQPKRVAYAGTNLPFYLLGSRLQNRVQYVNINRHTAFRMHDYHRLYDRPLSDSPTPDWDRREADEVAWLGNLREQRIDLLFVGFVNRIGGMHNVHDQDGFPLERTWADRNPAIFQPIHVDSRTRVYTVRFDNQSD